MSAEPRLFRIGPDNIDPDHREPEADFAHVGMSASDGTSGRGWRPTLGSLDGPLSIGKEFNGWDLTDERLDLLAVGIVGRPVVMELKRDDSGTDVHWQAIKYASHLQRASGADIAKLAADGQGCSPEEGELFILQHLGSDDLNGLNGDRRIILASQRFAPEVMSALLWLNRRLFAEESMDDRIVEWQQFYMDDDAHRGELAEYQRPVGAGDDLDQQLVEAFHPGGSSGGG